MKPLFDNSAQEAPRLATLLGAQASEHSHSRVAPPPRLAAILKYFKDRERRLDDTKRTLNANLLMRD
jgi:hypothetical protein